MTDRRALWREYRIRVAIVLLFMLSTACLVGVGSLFPGFTRASYEGQDAVNAVASSKKGKDDSGLSKVEAALSSDAALLAILNRNLGETPASSIITDLSSLRGPLRLSSFQVSRSSTSTVDVVIQGVSPTRDDLLSFKNRLENRLPGTTVDLPIAELAKKSNIQFSVHIIEQIP